MSDDASAPPGSPPRPPAHERDALPFARLLAIGLAGAAIVVLSVGWSAHFLRHRRVHQVTRLDEVGSAVQEIEGGRFTVPIAGGLIDRQRHQLASWSWADRAHGTVCMPISDAMDLYVRQLAAPAADAAAGGHPGGSPGQAATGSKFHGTPARGARP